MIYTPGLNIGGRGVKSSLDGQRGFAGYVILRGVLE